MIAKHIAALRYPKENDAILKLWTTTLMVQLKIVYLSVLNVAQFIHRVMENHVHNNSNDAYNIFKNNPNLSEIANLTFFRSDYIGTYTASQRFVTSMCAVQ